MPAMSARAVADDDVRTAMDAIRRIVGVLRRSARGAEKQVGISGAQLFVMHRLKAGALTINELATMTATHQSSVSVVVQRLVDRGLVTRTVPAHDRRRREITLTPAGRGVLRRAPSAAQDRLVGALTELPAPERQVLAAGLAALVRAMGADHEPAEMFFEDRAQSSTADGSARGRGLRSPAPPGGPRAARSRQARPLSRPRRPRPR
jgi:DNA-binding MarR family transcriptional regulator